MLLNPLTFHSPKSIDELLDLYGNLENVRLQAGGTFLLNALKLMKRNGAKTPEHVISLGQIEDLKGMCVQKDTLTIKSMTTIDEILHSAVCLEHFPVFGSICKNISTQPIRNAATIGGNLTCRYTWTEMPAVAIGLDATLCFKNKDGKEERVAAETFFSNAAKASGILTHIDFPIHPNTTTVYRRVRKTQFVDIPQLSLLIQADTSSGKLKDVRVAINNCVDFAQRDKTLEDFLNGQDITNENIAVQALDHVTETIYDKRANAYKKHMFRVSLKSALEELCRRS